MALLARGADPGADLLGEVGYNGLPTSKSKVTLALDQASGVTLWELTQDATGANSLLAAIGQVLAQRAAHQGREAIRWLRVRARWTIYFADMHLFLAKLLVLW